MDKNFIIAILLSILVIIVFTSPQYQTFFGKEVPPKAPEVSSLPERSPAPDPSPPTELRAPQAIEHPKTPVKQEDTASQTVQITQTDKPEREQIINLENDDISMDISTRSGAIVRATMKHFDGITEDDRAQLVVDGQMWCTGGVIDGDSQLSFKDIVFSVENRSRESVTLVADLTTNARIIRMYSLDASGYVMHTNTSLEGTWDNPELHYEWNGPINDTEIPKKKIRIFPFSMFSRDDKLMYSKISYLGDGDRTIIESGDEAEEKRIFPADGAQKLMIKKDRGAKDRFRGDLNWCAVRSKYFMAAAIPKDIKRWRASSESRIVTYNDKDMMWFDFTLSKSLSAGDTALDIYIGPISYGTIKSYQENLTEIMELSWRFIRPLSIAFLWIIKKIHRVIPNWGLVIIIFSIFIKVILYPLSKSSLRSMHKMSSLQPKITELREKYKNNPQKQHTEIMGLYKSEGINPLGGCLPMLFQMPVFFALYPVVGRAFELRKAMFIPHWIEDLSRPDPYYILPVAMGLSMFFQMKTTTKDPNQKAMLYVMPVVMVIMFSNFSAGLTLYWFMFNVMTFIQQKLIRVKTPQ